MSKINWKILSKVDDNVTRHLDKELNRNDWDVMITHYLGLDHIGHIEGPFNENMRKKLNQMDDIFTKLYEGLMKNVT